MTEILSNILIIQQRKNCNILIKFKVDEIDRALSVDPVQVPLPRKQENKINSIDFSFSLLTRANVSSLSNIERQNIFLVSVGANVVLVNIVNRGHLWVLQRRVDRGGSRYCNCVILELFSQPSSGLLSHLEYLGFLWGAEVKMQVEAFSHYIIFL